VTTRSVGLQPEHDWSSHGADVFGVMAIDYDELAQPANFNRQLSYGDGDGSEASLTHCLTKITGARKSGNAPGIVKVGPVEPTFNTLAPPSRRFAECDSLSGRIT
jgi:hypothetical protein